MCLRNIKRESQPAPHRAYWHPNLFAFAPFFYFPYLFFRFGRTPRENIGIIRAISSRFADSVFREIISSAIQRGDSRGAKSQTR